MANEQNLIRNEDLTPKQRRENASKAGKASAKKRAERKTLRDELLVLLETKVEDKTMQEKISFSLIQEALEGNVKAFETIRDTIGERPKEQIHHSGNINNPFADLSTEELRKLIDDE